jgi:hypothetical protein
MHPPAANSQQGERHQQQPQRRKGYDNKTEDAVVRVNKGGQTPGGQRRGGDQYIDEKKRPELLPAGAATKVKGLFPAAQIRLSTGHCLSP